MFWLVHKPINNFLQNLLILNNITSNFGQFNHLTLFALEFLNFWGKISDSMEPQKFLTQNVKAMAKDIKINIAVT